MNTGFYRMGSCRNVFRCLGDRTDTAVSATHRTWHRACTGDWRCWVHRFSHDFAAAEGWLFCHGALQIDRISPSVITIIFMLVCPVAICAGSNCRIVQLSNPEKAFVTTSHRPPSLLLQVIDNLINSSPESIARVAELAGVGPTRLQLVLMDLRDAAGLKRLFASCGPFDSVHAHFFFTLNARLAHCTATKMPSLWNFCPCWTTATSSDQLTSPATHPLPRHLLARLST